jgi:hypothetical protein
MNCLDNFTRRNLLWHVNVIPTCECPIDSSHVCTNRSFSPLLCSHVMNIPGYLLCIDEGDGFFLTWICFRHWNRLEIGCCEALDCFINIADRDVQSREIIVKEQRNNWTERSNGCLDSNNMKIFENHDIEIAFTARLQVDVLLCDILNRRPQLVPTYNVSLPSSSPPFEYTIVSVRERGKKIELVLAFEVSQQVGSIGVVVVVNIFTQEYIEVAWGRNKKVFAVQLKTWGQKLAAGRRMRERKVGPYCINPDDPVDWGCCGIEKHQSVDDFDDTDVDQWQQALLQASQQTTEGARLSAQVSFASLYPDCDVLDNRAVLNQQPIMFMRTGRAPVELVYC